MKTMTNLYCVLAIAFILNASAFAPTGRADSIVFDTFGPGDTYSQFDAYEVGTFFQTPVESAAQFTAGASGNLASVYLGLTYGRTDLPVNVYLYGDAGGSPDNANQIFLGSVTPIVAWGTTTNSVVSFSVAGTVPVTMGSTYWLVLKPTDSNVDNDWNASFPAVPGMTDYSIDDSGIWASYAPILPAFRLTATVPAPGYAAQVQQPINADGTSVFNVRRGVVPVKFTLTQGGVPTCDLPQATIAVTRTAGGTIGPIDESTYSGPADTGSNFRIDSCQYVYNLSASALGMGTYRVDVLINGQVVGSATFQLR
jgi:hypothetical protein